MSIELVINEMINILEFKFNNNIECIFTDIIYQAHSKIYGISSTENYSLIKDIIKTSCKKLFPNKDIYLFIYLFIYFK
jgi:hypothetical protein